MNKVRWRILNCYPKRRALILKVAQAAQVTVDALVQAGLNREVPSLPAIRNGKTAAHIAALALDYEHPGVFKVFGAWPYVCRFCSFDIPHAKKIRTCPFCSADGCDNCVSASGCPDCIQVAEQRRQATIAKRKLVQG